MKQREHIKVAEAIGADSYHLLHYSELPANSSRAKQMDALMADRRWQEDHANEISRRISQLIDMIAEVK